MSRRSRVRAPPGPMYLHFLPMKELTLSVSALTLLSHSPIREVTLHLPEMKQRLRYGCAVSSKTMFIDLSIFLLLSVSHNYSFSCILLNLLFLLPRTHHHCRTLPVNSPLVTSLFLFNIRCNGDDGGALFI